MKLRTRLAVAFLTITIVPMLLFYLLVLALSNYQTRSFTKEYGLTEQVDLFSGNSMQIFNRITKRSQEDIRNTLDNDPGLYNDLSYLDKVNAELKSHYAARSATLFIHLTTLYPPFITSQNIENSNRWDISPSYLPVICHFCSAALLFRGAAYIKEAENA